MYQIKFRDRWVLYLVCTYKSGGRAGDGTGAGAGGSLGWCLRTISAIPTLDARGWLKSIQLVWNMQYANVLFVTQMLRGVHFLLGIT